MTIFFRSTAMATKCIISLVLLLLSAMTDSAAQNFWQPSNGPYGGEVFAFAFNSSGHIFAGTTNSGVFRSMDNGNTWVQVNNGLTDLVVKSLAINKSGHIFAGTLYSGGIFRSINNGETWMQVNNGLTDFFISALAINDSGHVFAGTSHRLFRSRNNGDRWDSVLTVYNDTSFTSLAINNSGHIFAGTFGGGVFRSMDNGNNWTSVGLKPSEINANAINVLGINDKGVIFAAVANGVYRSTNNGDAWKPFIAGLANANVLSLSTNNSSGRIFTGTAGGGIFRSPDSIANWVEVNFGLAGKYVRSLGISQNGSIFASTRDGGVSRSTDNGASWTLADKGLINFGKISLAVSPNGDIFAGTSDGGVYRSTNQGGSWTVANNGLMNTNVLSIAINGSEHIFVGTFRGGVFRSLNNGQNWVHIGLNNIHVYSLAFNDSGYVFAGTDSGVFRLKDNGKSWVQINKGLIPQDAAQVLSFAINKNEHIFAGTTNGVFRSTDNGDNWTQINIGLNDLVINALAIDDSGYVYAGTNSSIFRSTNNGNNWTRIDAGLVGAPILCLARNMSGRVFAGTSKGGVFKSYDNGTIGEPIGLMNTQVFSLVFGDTGYLYAATKGGVFRSANSTLAPTTMTISAISIAPDSAILRGRANPNNLNTTVKFEYGLTMSYGSTVAAMPNLITGRETLLVSATIKNLSPGTTYHYRVVAINSAGTQNGENQMFTTQIPSYSPSLNLSTTISFPSRAKAPDYPATDYRIVGLPGASNQLVNSFLSGVQNKQWQAYRDNGAASNFFVVFDGSSTFQFSVGRAFWIINKGTLSINTTVPSTPLNTAQEIELPQPNSGWNLITNPFTASVAWSKIQSANNVTEPIYAFNGSFSTATSFDPYSGYYFFNATNLTKLKIPYSLYFSSTPAANADPAIWRVNILFSSGEINDKSTSFGIASEASPDLDRLDFRKPHALAATPSVEFKRPQWDAKYSTFATDIRPEFEDSESWEFNVRVISRQPAQLTFAGISKIPNQFEVHLIDADHAQSVNLREDSLYHFTPAAELMKFKVVVGRKEKVQEQLSSLALPKEFALGPNYPNPFSANGTFGNPTTTIPIAVPVASEIKLKLYNLLGAEVKTLYEGTVEAGRYWFNWDGRNELGNQVATGVYLFRLSTSTGVSLLGKMILMR